MKRTTCFLLAAVCVSALAKGISDETLADRVKKALEAQGVEVTATNGKVQLWGSVESGRERRRIEQTAAGVVGVRAIDSRLKVDPES
jgi:osmotically-inducible protein OsmY